VRAANIRAERLDLVVVAERIDLSNLLPSLSADRAAVIAIYRNCTDTCDSVALAVSLSLDARTRVRNARRFARTAAAEKALHGCPVDYQKLWRPLTFPVLIVSDYDGKECRFGASPRSRASRRKKVSPSGTPSRTFIKIDDRFRVAGTSFDFAEDHSVATRDSISIRFQLRSRRASMSSEQSI